ncbi:MAG: BREX-2 system phosphatase PglZ [Bryobacteraceae bacterium]|nr:BREX-2 system phosphatase PglZ [Bryobacteraceae bacterium]
MTPELLSATLRPDVDKEKALELAFALHSPTSWTGPSKLEISRQVVQVRYCRSALEMRESLCNWDHTAPLALVTPVEDHTLAADLSARLFKGRIRHGDVWRVLESDLGVRFVDGKLRTDTFLGNALLDIVSKKSVSPPVSGVLHEETVWDLILPDHFGIPSARTDLAGLLIWTRERNTFHSSDPQLRSRMIEFFTRKIGPSAKAVLDCCLTGADPLTVGLSFEPMLSAVTTEPARTELSRAFGRMERYTGNQPIPPAAASEWHSQAQTVAKSRTSDHSDLIDGVDRVLTAVGLEPHAHLSQWSRIGASQALDRFSEALSASALDELRKRHWPPSDVGILSRAEMLLRLSRWLETPDSDMTGLSSTVEWYRAEGSWVDWARSRLRFVSESSKWNAVVASVLERSRIRREEQNRRFAAHLADWTLDGSPGPVRGVETVLESVVAPLIENHPVLLIVMDGMSLPIARELASEFMSRRWNFWSNTSQELAPVVAALPSVTQYSRASLLAGRLASGAQDVESRSFSARPDLRRPVLFYKNDLAPASDEVIREIADTDRLVVGIVINAIDDELGGSRQISPDWTLDYLAVLRGILAEAATAGRVVVLTSDHGHMLDTGSTISRTGPATSDRWRSGESSVGDDEILVKGPRVLAPGGSMVGLAVESARYQRPKVGYHGGLTPQECLVSVNVLAQPAVQVRGWTQVSAEPPSWWSSETIPQPARQTDLFTPTPDWIGSLVRSELFQSQLANTNGRVVPEHVEVSVRALDAAGGRMLKSTFAARAGITLGRVSSYVAAVQRVLNMDGYGVLELDEASQTVTLNRPLLLKQFRLS